MTEEEELLIVATELYKEVDYWKWRALPWFVRLFVPSPERGTGLLSHKVFKAVTQ